jgi:hypothetical protein
MLVRIMAVVLLAASYATAAHAEEEGIANVPDRAVEQRDAEHLADAAVLEAGAPIDFLEADVVSAEVKQLAIEVGVEPIKLQGAVNRTGATPRAYLASEGLMKPPVSTVSSATSAHAYGTWDRLANCEASGDWHNARNPKYKGGLQMDAVFWARYGGLAFAPAPHLASREQQIVVAERGYAVQGPGAWPVCSRVIGMRR